MVDAAGDIGGILAKHDDFSHANPLQSDPIRLPVAGHLFQMLITRNMLIDCLSIAVAFRQHALSKSLSEGLACIYAAS